MAVLVTGWTRFRTTYVSWWRGLSQTTMKNDRSVTPLLPTDIPFNCPYCGARLTNMTKTDRLWAAVLTILWCVVLGAEQTAAYPVQRVVDGDTVILATIGTVRLIGVDTPETVDPRKPVQRFGLESAAFLRSLLDGQSVRVEYDRQGLDK